MSALPARSGSGSSQARHCREPFAWRRPPGPGRASWFRRRDSPAIDSSRPAGAGAAHGLTDWLRLISFRGPYREESPGQRMGRRPGLVFALQSLCNHLTDGLAPSRQCRPPRQIDARSACFHCWRRTRRLGNCQPPTWTPSSPLAPRPANRTR